MSQINSIIAVSHLKLKKNDLAKSSFINALKANENCPKNNTQIERTTFLLCELAKISARMEDLKESRKFAVQSLAIGKETDDDNYLDLFIELNPIFYKLLDVNKLNSNYKNMIKHVILIRFFVNSFRS